MSLTSRREALKLKIDPLGEDDLSEAERFIDALHERAREVRALIEMIRSLPRIITDYPILLWGYDPCDSNSIECMWLGPSTTAVSGTRKGYPMYRGLSQDDRPMLTCHWGSIESDWDADWLASADIPSDVLAEYLQWLVGPKAPMLCSYDPTAPRRLRHKASGDLTASERKRLDGMSPYRLSQERLATLKSQIDSILEAVQDLLTRRGMRLWSDQPDKSFSFNREQGTIEICEAEKFRALFDPQAPAPRTEVDPVDWSGLSPGPIDLSGVDLSGAILRGADLSPAKLSGCNLSGADLREVRFMSYDEDTDELWTADLSGVDLTGAQLSGATFADESGDSSVSLAGQDLTGCDLSGADLTGCDLSGADLTGCDLSGAILRGARLDGTVMRFADLAGCDLRRADLSGLDLDDEPSLDGAVYDETTRLPEGLDLDADPCEYQLHRLGSGVRLHSAVLAGFDLSGVDLTGTRLSLVSLRGATLTGTTLAGAVLDRVDLSDADLTGADLTSATLRAVVTTDRTRLPAGIDGHNISPLLSPDWPTAQAALAELPEGVRRWFVDRLSLRPAGRKFGNKRFLADGHRPHFAPAHPLLRAPHALALALSLLREAGALDAVTSLVLDRDAMEPSQLYVPQVVITTLDPIAGLTGLRCLSADVQQCPDLTGLASCTAISHLYLTTSRKLARPERPLIDLSAVANLPALEFFRLGASVTCEDLSALANLPSLRVVHIFNGSRLKTLSGFEGTPGLRSIERQGGQIIIYKCPHLTGKRPMGLDAKITCKIYTKPSSDDPN